MFFDLKRDATKPHIYKLMSQTVIPRPIAWVVTEDEGVINIAPFSYFIPLSSNPATVLISVGHKADGTPKDTLANLRQRKTCTICMVQEEALETMHLSSKSLPKAQSEATYFGIETKQVLEGYPPMIVDVPVAYFCTLNQEITLGGPTIPLILNVEQMFVAEDAILDQEHLEISFNPVARIGKAYAFLGDSIEAPKIP